MIYIFSHLLGTHFLCIMSIFDTIIISWLSGWGNEKYCVQDCRSEEEEIRNRIELNILTASTIDIGQP